MSDSDSEGETVRRVYGIRKPTTTTLYGSSGGQREPRFHALATKLATKSNHWGDSSSDDEYEPPSEKANAVLDEMEDYGNKVLHDVDEPKEEKKEEKPKVEETNPFQAEPVTGAFAAGLAHSSEFAAPHPLARRTPPGGSQKTPEPRPEAHPRAHEARPYTPEPKAKAKPEPKAETKPIKEKTIAEMRSAIESDDTTKNMFKEMNAKLSPSAVNKLIPILSDLISMLNPLKDEELTYENMSSSEKRVARNAITTFKARLKTTLAELRKGSGGSSTISTAEALRLIRKHISL
jgi:hypothetical protein